MSERNFTRAGARILIKNFRDDAGFFQHVLKELRFD